MKKNKLIAAILFGVLSVIQFFGLTYVLANTLAQMPALIYVEIAALVVYIITTVKLFKTADVSVTIGEKRAFAALSIMYFAAIALNSTMFSQLLGLSLVNINQEFAMNPTTGVAFLIIRTAILFAALCFIIFNEKEKVAILEFEQGVAPAELETPEAVETITDKLDEVEA